MLAFHAYFLIFSRNYSEYLEKKINKQSNSEIFITLEPCSKKGKTGACVDALKKYDFKRVIVGSQDPTQNGLKSLSKHGFKMTNLNDADCIALNKEFFYKDKFNKPVSYTLMTLPTTPYV